MLWPIWSKRKWLSQIKSIMYSFVIPVYNGAETLPALCERIENVCNEQGWVYEMILVYDCGKDASWEVILQLQQTYKQKLKAVRLTRNYGQHNALICGFRYAEGNYIVTLDEDLQQDPADLPDLVKEQEAADYDLVYGRYPAAKHGWFRNLSSQLMRRLIVWGLPDLHKDYSAFRLIKREIALASQQMNNSYTFLDGYLSWVTTHVSSIHVTHQERAAGESGYNFRRLFEHSINIFVTFSNKPIRFFTYTALLVFLLSTAYSLYVLIRKLVYNDFISGFATSTIFMGMGFGLVLLGLGIIGEYIYRINMKTTRRPNASVREVRLWDGGRKGDADISIERAEVGREEE